MDWIIEKRSYPQEIVLFLEKTFEIFEVRGRLGSVKGILFFVHSNEANHSVPHIHAKYGEYEISIEIATSKVLCGNIPVKQQKTAISWVCKNKEKLLNEWNGLVISASSSLTKSALDLK